jgi:hypothetical protein
MAGLATRVKPFGQPRPAVGVLLVGFAEVGDGDGAHGRALCSDVKAMFRAAFTIEAVLDDIEEGSVLMLVNTK